MTARNPFRIIRKAVRAVALTLFALFVVAFFGLLGSIMLERYTFGEILLGAAGLVGFFTVVGLLLSFGSAIKDAWLRAERRHDTRRRKLLAARRQLTSDAARFRATLDEMKHTP
ncbi:hypothetical protein BKA24_001748 [Microbacterium marinum]|uniref:Uncharacterized protein n=1 Tax=Microbacterium marinum TaxID=421115 RepID=A0A7W7BST9_9MICO|nr:hypothetical protein [Microbacterium marinum]MBB4667039.1 hypothetical protein [Microbacterium marinum]